LFGGARSGTELNGGTDQTTFALAAGGGVDVVFTKHLAWRFAQIDYLMTNFSGPLVGASSRQNNLRLGTGIVYRFGIRILRLPEPSSDRACSANPNLRIRRLQRCGYRSRECQRSG